MLLPAPYNCAPYSLDISPSRMQITFPCFCPLLSQHGASVHVCVCQKCAWALPPGKPCPLCRQTIEAIQPVWYLVIQEKRQITQLEKQPASIKGKVVIQYMADWIKNLNLNFTESSKYQLTWILYHEKYMKKTAWQQTRGLQGT